MVALPGHAASPEDTAMAEALFRDGQTLIKEKKVAAACDKFQESQRLDPQLGTLLHLATCHAEQGRVASAWVEFTEAAALAAHAGEIEREKLARERARELEPKVPKLVIQAEAQEPAPSLSLDGRELGRATLGTALPIDPGSHTLTATAPGKNAWKSELDLKAGSGETRVDIPVLLDISAAEVAPAPRPRHEAAPDSDVTPSSGQKTLGFVVGGVGLVALGVGGYFGLRAASQKSDADSHCNGTLCTQEGLDGHDDSKRSARIADVGIGLGVVALGVGTYLVLSAPKSSEHGARRPKLALGVCLDPRAATLSIGGAL
jgi:hypothetical protein